jgi:hypothetical protein
MDAEELLTSSKAGRDTRRHRAMQSLLQTISSRAVLLNIVVLIGNGAALTVWYISVRSAWSEEVQAASASPSAAASALPRLSDLPLDEMSTAPAVLLPGALIWREIFSSRAGSNVSMSASAGEMVPEATRGKQMFGFVSGGRPRLMQLPRPPTISFEYGRLTPLTRPRRRPTIELWGWVPVSHSEAVYYEWELAGDAIRLMQTLLGDGARAAFADRLHLGDNASASAARGG